VEVLHQEVSPKGSLLHVKRWLKGVHPHLGKITWGLTGLETLVEKDLIKPSHFFIVV
jgi:hypothetical protein